MPETIKGQPIEVPGERVDRSAAEILKIDPAKLKAAEVAWEAYIAKQDEKRGTGLGYVIR